MLSQNALYELQLLYMHKNTDLSHPALGGIGFGTFSH